MEVRFTDLLLGNRHVRPWIRTAHLASETLSLPPGRPLVARPAYLYIRSEKQPNVVSSSGTDASSKLGSRWQPLSTTYPLPKLTAPVLAGTISALKGTS